MKATSISRSRRTSRQNAGDLLGHPERAGRSIVDFSRGAWRPLPRAVLIVNPTALHFLDVAVVVLSDFVKLLGRKVTLEGGALRLERKVVSDSKFVVGKLSEFIISECHGARLSRRAETDHERPHRFQPPVSLAADTNGNCRAADSGTAQSRAVVGNARRDPRWRCRYVGIQLRAVRGGGTTRASPARLGPVLRCAIA